MRYSQTSVHKNAMNTEQVTKISDRIIADDLSFDEGLAMVEELTSTPRQVLASLVHDRAITILGTTFPPTSDRKRLHELAAKCRQVLNPTEEPDPDVITQTHIQIYDEL